MGRLPLSLYYMECFPFSSEDASPACFLRFVEVAIFFFFNFKGVGFCTLFSFFLCVLLDTPALLFLKRGRLAPSPVYRSLLFPFCMSAARRNLLSCNGSCFSFPSQVPSSRASFEDRKFLPFYKMAMPPPFPPMTAALSFSLADRPM